MEERIIRRYFLLLRGAVGFSAAGAAFLVTFPAAASQ